MRAPAGVAGTRPRRPAQAPTLPLHLAGFRKFPAARHRCRLWPAPPQPSCETGARMVSFLPPLGPLPLRQPPSWGRRQSWPLQEGSGCGHLPQPGTWIAAQRGALHLRSRDGGTPPTHAVNSCQPARRASLVPTQPDAAACRNTSPAGRRCTALAGTAPSTYGCRGHFRKVPVVVASAASERRAAAPAAD